MTGPIKLEFAIMVVYDLESVLEEKMGYHCRLFI